MVKQIKLKLPFPPSVNSIWRLGGAKIFKSKKYCAYLSAVAGAAFFADHLDQAERYEVELYLFPADKRVRDVDNAAKATLDALTQAGIFTDDKNVIKLTIQKAEKIAAAPFSFVVVTADPEVGALEPAKYGGAQKFLKKRGRKCKTTKATT